MSLYTTRYNPKAEFDIDNTSIDSLIMTAEGVLQDLKDMKKLGVVAEDNQGGVIGMSCETADPLAIVELKKMGFEEEK
jgi:hypothetical protein